jgi:starvation-inducible DNA-binding protein
VNRPVRRPCGGDEYFRPGALKEIEDFCHGVNMRRGSRNTLTRRGAILGVAGALVGAVVRGRHFRDHHLLLDEHAEQIFAMRDVIAERACKIGGTTLRSIGDISRHQRLQDNNSEFVTPKEMLTEVLADNRRFTRSLRTTHEVCERHSDIATASLIEIWIDETERRAWFLSEIVRDI